MYAPGKPSVIGCGQAQELGIITVNIDEIQSSDNPAKQAAAQGKLSKELILQEYKDNHLPSLEGKLATCSKRLKSNKYCNKLHPDIL